MKRTIIYSCVSLLIAFSATVNGADNAAKIRVACMGNSITAGKYNYPTSLGGLLGDDYDVRSFGKGGSGVFIEDRIAWEMCSESRQISKTQTIIPVIWLSNRVMLHLWK
ncbi:MAG: hypothetical protein LBS25_05320 [Candidatus Symbiothrix sp.]|jgi:hypothetical protein|nr:hypothetical protein [Candidatus Symbiothrix sp.]